ncbi:MAG: undecaprenyl/decaprenyl-phosphate alpha-N-acetylglucosaminyl 1-phosphate transferase [Chloroflexota bacterium]|nr:undecaprenyl/decaprenyl-phosphate alpha-N-acetylglucosaminyl 1-phosphate transferase [Chloroflexota bacterium]MDQ5868032.1 undecaprenyl/decaprenyl-phosphate alpha-N-acetylglucosaminyl 1-phosphate transferase [Chloroflexota bacterium]
MSHLPTMILLFGVTLALSLGLTPLVRWAALRVGWVDRPGEARRVHTVPVPRLGGLAIYVAFAVGVLLTFVFPLRGPYDPGDNARFEGGRVLLMLLGAGLIALVMAVDDVKGLKPLPRLAWQLSVAFLMVVPSLIVPGGRNCDSAGICEPAGTVHYDQGAGILATGIQNPFRGISIPFLNGDPLDATIDLWLPLAVIFTVVWIAGVTNTINWIDGLDGLAAGVTVIACLVLFVLTVSVGQVTLAYVPLLLAAAVLGFLPYNIHPARIFMGDSGAMFLGFTLAIISLIGGAKLAAALLVLGIPLLDSFYMIVYRLMRGRSPVSADRGHLHHRLHDMGLSHGQVMLIYMVLCGTFGLVGMINSETTFVSPLVKLLVMVLMALVLAAIAVYISRRRFDRDGPAGDPATRASRGVQTSTPDH